MVRVFVVAVAELETVAARVKQAQLEYEALQKEQIKPAWPAKFDPIDPSAPAPAIAPPPPRREFGAATQPTGLMP